MCHRSVLDWMAQAVAAQDVAGRRVLEVGSFNVNGSVRPGIEAHGPAAYVGVDASAGPGVDRVVHCEELVSEFGTDAFDVVVCAEVLEHVTDWRSCVLAMCEVLRPGGLWFVTTRSPGFPYHPFPIDAWRYTEHDMRAILRALDMLGTVDPDWQAPGVFVKAMKPLTAWKPDVERLAAIDVQAMVGAGR